ncbi:MAG: cysteine desulfurase [Deltaproteobacteria bacterium]|nr:cysteine desulfurase [Deltaproteobacteria bacterium]
MMAAVSTRPAERATGDLPRYDVGALRTAFPALHQAVHGQPLVYLDNGATTQKPRAVIDAVVSYYTTDCANVHRGAYLLSERATLRYDAARHRVAEFLHAATDQEIVFVRGATEAINLVAAGFARSRLQPGDEVLLSEMEHHSNIVPWQLACEATGAVIKVLPFDDQGVLELDRLDALLGPKTRIVAVTHVSNVLGTVNPVAEIVRRAHARGIPVLVDGAQAVPHLPVDVQALGCDYYVFSGHKVYGPTGIGVLYGTAEALQALPPYQGGGDMVRTVTFPKTTYAPIPSRFEAGTPDIAGAIGLKAALDFVATVGFDAIADHEHRLLALASHALAAIPEVRLVGTAPGKASVLAFTLGNVHPHDLATILDRQGVAIRAGHHCAQPVVKHYGVPAVARASFALYNTEAEVSFFADALVKAQEIFKR